MNNGGDMNEIKLEAKKPSKLVNKSEYDKM